MHALVSGFGDVMTTARPHPRGPGRLTDRQHPPSIFKGKFPWLERSDRAESSGLAAGWLRKLEDHRKESPRPFPTACVGS